MTIRPATNADTQEVVRVIRAVYDEYGFAWDEEDYHADLHDISAFYADRGDFFWVALVDDVIVGTTALDLFPTIEETPQEGYVRIVGTDCSLERLYVHPDGRCGGVGSALFLHTLATAREQGRKAMEIWSDKRFEAAHRLYQKHGAVVVADRICDDPDESPEWGLRLGLLSSGV